MSALILDGHTKSALAITRSLGKRGIDTIVCAKRGTAMARYSRFAKKTSTYPSPLQHPTDFVEHIVGLAKQCSEKPVIFCCSDSTVLPLVRERKRVEEYAILQYADTTAVECAFSKACTLQRAQECGVPVPESFAYDDRHACTYPVIVKPQHTASWNGKSGFRATAQPVFSLEELEALYTDICAQSDEPPLLQHMLQGEEIGVEFLCNHGTILATAAHKRVRSLTPRGGVSVVKQSINPSYKDIDTYGQKLMKELQWHGVAMVEFKVDHRTGEPVLMEINGRFWGSLPLAIASGVDVPYLYYLLAQGDTSVPDIDYQENVYTRHLLGDIKHLALSLFKHDPLRATLYPSRWKAVRDFCTGFCMQHDVWSLSDPLPGILEPIDHIRALL